MNPATYRMTYFFHEGKEEQWKSLGPDDIRRYRNKMISHLKEVEESGESLVWTPNDVGGRGRGIILTGGEGVSFRFRWSVWNPRSVTLMPLAYR
jgi:hypothetical protein